VSVVASAWVGHGSPHRRCRGRLHGSRCGSSFGVGLRNMFGSLRVLDSLLLLYVSRWLGQRLMHHCGRWPGSRLWLSLGQSDVGIGFVARVGLGVGKEAAWASGLESIWDHLRHSTLRTVLGDSLDIGCVNGFGVGLGTACGNKSPLCGRRLVCGAWTACRGKCFLAAWGRIRCVGRQVALRPAKRPSCFRSLCLVIVFCMIRCVRIVAGGCVALARQTL
jgi:hypothetical protein